MGGPGGFVGFRIGHATNVTVKNVTFLNNLKSHFLELAGVKNAEIQDVRSGASGKSLQAADRNVSSWMPVCREFSQDIFHMTEVSVRTL